MIGKIALTAVALAVGTTMAKTQPEAETIAKEWRLLGRDIVHRAENCPLARDRNTPLPFTPPEAECADRQALVWETDRDPLDIVLRRTRALADDIACPKECSDALDALAAAAAKTALQRNAGAAAVDGRASSAAAFNTLPTRSSEAWNSHFGVSCCSISLLLFRFMVLACFV